MRLSLRSDKVRQRLDQGRLRLAPGRLSIKFINASQALQFLHLSLPLSGSLPFHGVRYLFIIQSVRINALLDDQRFYAMFQPSDPEVRHVPCAVLIYSRSPQETFLRKRDRKIICSSIVFISGSHDIFTGKVFDVYPELRTNEQYYFE